MKPLNQLALCILMVVCAQAGEHSGLYEPPHSSGHQHSAVRTQDHGRRAGYGYGGYGYGGYYEPYHDSGYYPPPNPAGSNLTVVYPAAAPPEPPAPVHPVIHEYGQPEDYGTPAPSNSGPILYLIAFRDKNIRAATTYWVDSGTLHYLDTDHREHQAPIASVDRDLSAQLNQERRVPFHLP